MVYEMLELNSISRRITQLRVILVVALAICLASSPVAAGPYLDYATRLNQSPPAGTQYRDDLESALVRLANAYRAQKGRKPLKADAQFRVAARAHAADMMLHNFMGHRASTGHNFDSRIRVFVDDITRFPGLAENAARDTQKTPADAAKAKSLFAQWVKSRAHRNALVSRNYQFVSTGVIQRGNSIWAVQIFFAAPRQKGMFQ
jgi:uncharacterized protein YkwD